MSVGVYEIKAPASPDNAPMKAEISNMTFRFSVQKRAAAAGVISNAAINTTPTAWIPATTATFDAGILVVGGSRAGCLWVEDED